MTLAEKLLEARDKAAEPGAWITGTLTDLNKNNGTLAHCAKGWINHAVGYTAEHSWWLAFCTLEIARGMCIQRLAATGRDAPYNHCPIAFYNDYYATQADVVDLLDDLAKEAKERGW